MVHWLCTSYIGLPAHRTRHVISEFNSCSRDKSRTGLKRHRRGYDTRRRSSQAYPSLCRVLLGSPGLKFLISGPLSSSSPYPCITTVLRILLNYYRHYSTSMAYDPNIPVFRDNQGIGNINPTSCI